MANTYSIEAITTNTTDANACFEIRAGNKQGKIKKIKVRIRAATASVFAVGIAAAQGITPTTPKTPIKWDQINAPTSSFATALAWGTGPTIPTGYVHKFNFPATALSEATLDFGDGLTLANDTSLILWNLGTTSAADVYIQLEE